MTGLFLIAVTEPLVWKCGFQSNFVLVETHRMIFIATRGSDVASESQTLEKCLYLDILL